MLKCPGRSEHAGHRHDHLAREGHAAAVDEHEREHDEDAPTRDPLTDHAAHRRDCGLRCREMPESAFRSIRQVRSRPGRCRSIRRTSWTGGSPNSRGACSASTSTSPTTARAGGDRDRRRQVRRLRRLLPSPPARSSTPAAARGCTPCRWPRSATRDRRRRERAGAPACAGSGPRRHLAAPSASSRATCGMLRWLPEVRRRAARVLVLEAFPRPEQPGPRAHRDVAGTDGMLIAELRLRPDQPPGRIDWWDVVPDSLLSDRRHLLLGDAVYDQRRHTYVLREIAIHDDGSVAVQQTSGWLCPFASIPRPLRTRGAPGRDHVRWMDRRVRRTGCPKRSSCRAGAGPDGHEGLVRAATIRLLRSGSPVWS